MNRACIRTVSMVVASISLSLPALAAAQQRETPRSNTEKLMLSLALGLTWRSMLGRR